jgi:hypothetical protein
MARRAGGKRAPCHAPARLNSRFMKTTHQILLTDDYIAEAQRLSIAQNTTLRLMHQTWWLLWLSRLILLAAAIVSYWILDDWIFPVFFIGGMIALSFLGQYMFRRNLAKARKKSPAKDTTTTVSMDANGIDLSGANGNSQLKWSALLKPTIYSNGALIKFTRFSMLWLPDQSLIEGTPAQVRQLLAENVKDHET